jgi:hypothetical protein
MKEKFIIIRGMEKIEVEADSVALITPEGREIELAWRRGDKIASVSCDGQLIVRPMAANVVRLEVER